MFDTNIPTGPAGPGWLPNNSAFCVCEGKVTETDRLPEDVGPYDKRENKTKKQPRNQSHTHSVHSVHSVHKLTSIWSCGFPFLTVSLLLLPTAFSSWSLSAEFPTQIRIPLSCSSNHNTTISSALLTSLVRRNTRQVHESTWASLPTATGCLRNNFSRMFSFCLNVSSFCISLTFSLRK